MALASANEKFEISDNPEWSPVRWALEVWIWVLIVSLLVAFEVFGDPFLASFVLCLKLGLADIWGAFRNHSRTSDLRGSLLVNALVSRAFLKIAFAAPTLAIGITLVEPALGMKFGVSRIIVGVGVTYCGFFLAMIGTVSCSIVMNRNRYRFWLDRFSGRQPKQWPPVRFAESNHMPWILLGGMVATTIVVLPYTVGFLFAPNRIPGMIFASVFLGVWFLMVRSMYRALSLSAQSVEECWPKPEAGLKHG